MESVLLLPHTTLIFLLNVSKRYREARDKRSGSSIIGFTRNKLWMVRGFPSWKKGGHSATDSSDEDTYLYYNTRGSFPHLNIHLGSGFWMSLYLSEQKRKNWRKGQGRLGWVWSSLHTHWLVMVCEFPVSSAQWGGNWFIAIFVGTNLGGWMAKDNVFAWSGQLVVQAGKIIVKEDKLELPYPETAYLAGRAHQSVLVRKTAAAPTERISAVLS